MPTDGISSMVRRMTPTRYTVAEASKILGRHPDTLTRWRKSGLYSPSDSVIVGQLKVWLYTDKDLEEMKKLTKTLKPGKKAHAS